MNKKELILGLRKEGFNDKILRAFEKIPRENFVPEKLRNLAYENIALPLASGATISQPYTIAFMLSLMELKKGQKILEIGSGSGYVLALLSEITKGEIYGMEIIKNLVEKSKETLKKYKNVKIISRDGSRGLETEAPFDRILISADTKRVPEHLYSQLKEKGILVAPVGGSILQIIKGKEKIRIKSW
jgi:protein-L-isoaspartate(D-aspartate) O-methyltransferase